MDAALTALIDQATAANREAWQSMDTITRRVGLPAVVILGPAAARILDRYAGALLAGTLDRCPHLRPNAPMPQVWCAWSPDYLCCV